MLSDLTHRLKIIDHIYYCKFVVIIVNSDLVCARKSMLIGLELVGICLVYFLLGCLICWVEVG
jgi:hypothetical protein